MALRSPDKPFNVLLECREPGLTDHVSMLLETLAFGPAQTRRWSTREREAASRLATSGWRVAW